MVYIVYFFLLEINQASFAANGWSHLHAFVGDYGPILVCIMATMVISTNYIHRIDGYVQIRSAFKNFSLSQAKNIYKQPIEWNSAWHDFCELLTERS